MAFGPISNEVDRYHNLTHQALYDERLKMEVKNLQGNYPNFYELSLLLASSQSRNCASGESDWESFIDNLSRISDEFAAQIQSKEESWNETLRSDYRPAYQV
jgi:hypothetical protein